MTEITKERRDAIRAAAMKATPGPWEATVAYGNSEDDVWVQITAPDCDAVVAKFPEDTNDIPHIANCDPQTILALLDALDAAEAKMGADGRARALALLQAEDERQDKIHVLLETIREQIRVDIEPEHRDEGLMTNIQNAVYAMRGRMRLMNNAAITSPLYAAPPAAEPVIPTHRHKKIGTEYVLVGIGRMQAENWYRTAYTTDDGHEVDEPQQRVDMREVAIYRSVDDGWLWVRPREEFEDGRFEALTPSPEPSHE